MPGRKLEWKCVARLTRSPGSSVRKVAEVRLAGALLLAALAACARPAADDPVARAAEFIELARAGNCREAFALYTAASQQNLRAFSDRLKKNTPYYTEANEAFHLHCHVFAEYLPNSVTDSARSASGDTAYLRAIMRTGSRIVIPFLTDPIKETPVSFAMVREHGAWKMVAPHVQVQDARRQELEIGKFTVQWERRPATEVRGFRVSGRLTVTPEDVERVMLDFGRWPEWMPYVREARALTQPSDTARPRRQLVYVRLAADKDSAGIDFVLEFTNNARTQDGGHRAFTGSWRPVRHALAAPLHTTRGTVWGVSFRASIDAGGTQMRFGYAALPAEWPMQLRSAVFRPEHAAGILSALEQQASRRASVAAGP